MRATEHQRIVRELQAKHAEEVAQLKRMIDRLAEDRDHWKETAGEAERDYRQALEDYAR